MTGGTNAYSRAKLTGPDPIPEYLVGGHRGAAGRPEPGAGSHCWHAPCRCQGRKDTPTLRPAVPLAPVVTSRSGSELPCWLLHSWSMVACRIAYAGTRGAHICAVRVGFRLAMRLCRCLWAAGQACDAQGGAEHLDARHETVPRRSDTAAGGRGRENGSVAGPARRT